MNKILKIAIVSIICGSVQLNAQYSNVSKPISIHIEKEVIPPYLRVKEGSVEFTDDNQNGCINANETSYITLIVQNTGKGTAYGCSANIQALGTQDGLTFNNQILPTIEPGNSLKISIPITSSTDTKSGEVQFTIVVEEPNGFGTDPVQIAIKTHKFDAPNVEIVSHNIDGHSASGNLQKKVPFTLQLLLQNTDQGIAKDVKMELKLPENMFLLEGTVFQQFPTLQPNEKKLILLELQTNASVPDDLDLQVALSESYGKYAKNAVIPLHFGQSNQSTTTVTIDSEEYKETQITRGSLRTITGPVMISSITITTPVAINEMSSVLVTYKNMFGKYEMPEKDEPFPFTLIRLAIKGDAKLVRLATQSLSLDMGQFYATEQTVPLSDKILFLVSSNVKNIYLVDSNGQRQMLYSGWLLPNKIYDGTIEVK